MSQQSSTFRRWFLLPTVLVSVHTALVIMANLERQFGSHSRLEAIPWFLLYYIDCAACLLRRDFTTVAAEAPVLFCVLGLLFWGSVGFLLQSCWRWIGERWEQKDEIVDA
jgi:hypothetical protein